MNKIYPKVSSEILLSILFAVGVFISKMGVGILDPTEIDWLMTSGSDWTPDYMAWLFYRHADWQFPIGLFYGYSFPEPVSAGLTGSIPLLAVPFKMINFILPDTFQYFGWWLLLCYILQAFLGYKVLQAIGVKDKWILALGACFMVLSYSMLDRIAHMNLCAHWIVLAGIYLYFVVNDKSAWWKQGLLVALSIWTHPYLIVFTVLIGAAHFFRLWIESKNTLLVSLLYGVGMMGIAASAWFLIGNHVLESDQALGDGFGIYSANLNTFFTPKTDGPIIKALPRYYETQFEGVAYLGIGSLLFFFFVPYLIWKNKIAVKVTKLYFPILLLSLGLFILALSHIITLNQHLLFTIPLPDLVMEKLGIFRSSGRYVWLLQYLIMAHIIWLVDQVDLKSSYKYFIIGGMILLNLIDFWPQIERNVLTEKAHPVIHGFHQNQWDKIILKSSEFMMYPAHERIYEKYGDDMLFAEIAGRYKKNFNSGHLARFDYNLRMNFQKAQKDSLYFLPDNLRKRTVISSERFLNDLDKFILSDHHWLISLDGYYTMLPKSEYSTIAEVEQELDLKMEADTIRLEKEYFNAFLERNSENYLLISVMDEATTYLENCPEIQRFFNDINSDFTALNFRESFAGIYHRGNILTEERSGEKEVLLNQKLDLESGEEISVEILSAGHEFGNEARIFVNGKDYAINDRGINIVVLDTQGRVVESTFFDTYMLCHHFTENSQLFYKVWRKE